MQAPSQEQCRNQEISAWRHGCVWSLRGTPACGVVKENIRYVAANGTITKKPSSLRKKETFGSRESLYKCCDRKTAGSTQLAKGCCDHDPGTGGRGMENGTHGERRETFHSDQLASPPPEN
ncbi:uncharacterized protein LOC112626482 [Theropithecus gelada]|uniref:uncharacterized protein LOC112626482 n=1 Tax=Theropithecus gelada TaxID=9565 RepID=UPI000DC19510|nr:uncharacterized protein LOC112626482 [Theropithecus gelada]